MSVRAKFKVSSIARQTGWTPNGQAEVQVIKLSPVSGESEENKRFYAATPGGEITLSVVPKDVGDQFDLGKEFYVDFTPAN